MPARTSARRGAAVSLLGGALAAATASAAQDHLEGRWYRVEVAVFAQAPAAGEREEAGPGRGETEASAARAQELAGYRYPRPKALLRPAARDSALRFGLPLGLPLAADQLPPVVLSNLPPPAWHFGPCALPAWQQPSADPCLPGPPVDLEAEFPDAPFADWPGHPPTPVPPRTLPRVPAPVPAAAPDQTEIDAEAQLASDLAAHETALRRSSYVWQGTAPSLAAHVRRLARQRPILAFGSWQQALPSRESPQSLALQAGEPDAARRYPLEGTLAATIGRYLHFAASLQWRLPDGGIALLTEQRRLRSGELHYLDHPAFGVLVQLEPLALPADLQQRLAALEDDADIRERH